MIKRPFTGNGYVKPYRPSDYKVINKPWTQDETMLLLKQVGEKCSLDEISRKQRRPINEIRSKLKCLAAEMYLKGNIPFDEIHEATGIEKHTLILTRGSINKEYLESENTSNLEDTVIHQDVFVKEIQPNENVTMINVNVKDTADNIKVIVSVESLCQRISGPIIKTFTTCSNFAKLAC
jgi:hypothetical protein